MSTPRTDDLATVRGLYDHAADLMAPPPAPRHVAEGTVMLPVPVSVLDNYLLGMCDHDKVRVVAQEMQRRHEENRRTTEASV